MPDKISYKSTINACYIGHFVLAAVINTTPILFLTLMEQYGLTFEKLGRLVLINFATQVTVDLLFSRVVDKYGIRPFIAASQALAFAGFVLFALSPALFPGRAYTGFTAATVVCSCGGGLLELLLSPIVNAVPTGEKEKAMSLLHAFYAWGQVTVVLLTSVLLYFLGKNRWQVIPVFWSLLPLANLFLFLKVPLAPLVPEEHRTKTRVIVRNGYFLLCLAAIFCGGAAEIIMAQWSSGFLEDVMGLPKILGDYAGVGLFALFIGIGRTVYGKKGAAIDIAKAMTAGSLLCTVCFLTVVFSRLPALSLAACALSGLGVSLLWPGTIVVASAKFPLAGASMFALLASAGDFGAALGPWLVGFTADKAAEAGGVTGLRAGFLLAAVFPLALIAVYPYLGKKRTAGGS